MARVYLAPPLRVMMDVMANKFGILPRFTGVAVHDAHKRYDSFTGCGHALCSVHVMRELSGAGDFEPVAREDGWADQSGPSPTCIQGRLSI